MHPLFNSQDESAVKGVYIPSHFSFFAAYETLQKWQERFPYFKDDRIFNDLMLLYLLATKKYLDHRSASHLSRLILSIHFMQKTLQRSFVSSPQVRHLEVKWLPTRLSFPFSSKTVLGCLVGFNLTDRYELFDEENILLVLRKNHPDAKIVKDSSYYHVLPDKNLKIIYFEIEKIDGSCFSLAERHSLGSNLEKQIRGGFQKLAPTVFMRRNEEEVYKTILTLSREIHSVEDIPQAWISFEQQRRDEVIFLVVLVYASPKSHFPLHKCFISSPDCTFVSERLVTVRHLQEHPIEAHVFRLHIDRALSFVRSDGSLDFYASRQKVVSLINAAIGEFRDYNGGSLIKQRELLDDFKMRFPLVAQSDSELMETFFYGLTPLEKQALIVGDTLATLFQNFLENYNRKLPVDIPYLVELQKNEKDIFIAVQGHNASWKEAILEAVEGPDFKKYDFTYTIVDIPEGLFFHGVLPNRPESEAVIAVLQQGLHAQHEAIKNRQVLRIGMEYVLVSLDPRVGGDFVSSEALRLLFEGLTRFDRDGHVENGIAEAIEVSSDLRRYTFKLRPAQWNDGSPVLATDFEYAWKKVLSPDFKTAFAYLFYPIKYAREAKEGKISVDQVRIFSLDERTLQVDLAHPTPYFLELTAQPIYFPVRQLVDQKDPQWPYQTGDSYPCNGPFQLSINDANQQTFRFFKNPTYWDMGSIALDEVLLTQLNPLQSFQSFQKGELNWIGNPFGGWHSFYSSRAKDWSISIPNVRTYWCVLNTLCLPLKNNKVRQALAFALDRAELIANSFIPLTPAYSLLSERNHPQAFFPKRDVLKAVQLFEEGLAELGLTKAQLPPLNFLYHAGGISDDVALRFVQQLQSVFGIECHPQPLDWNSILSKVTQADFQMSLISWVPRTQDPIITLNTFRYAQNFNMAHWEDPLFQHWLRLSDQEENKTKRTEYLSRAEQRLCQEVPVIPLFYWSSQSLVSQDLEVVYHHSVDIARCKYAYGSRNPLPMTTRS